MMAPRSVFAALAGFALSLPAVLALPAPHEQHIQARASAITPLSTSQISSFKPYSWFASTAYCAPATTVNWTCGTNCQGNADFVPVAVGGDGAVTQFWYVGYSPSLASVIVSHQGTNFTKIAAILTDAIFVPSTLDTTLFPGISSSVLVHTGFAASHARSAPSILAAVQKTINTYNASTVTLVGHSLGGALALLDSVYLPLHISGVTFRTVTYGMPRVGNQAFADYVDANNGLGLNHVNNKEDPVPTLPLKLMGFHHPSGEVHITDANVWENCPGQDNPSSLCTAGDVNIFNAVFDNHLGPYDGVTMEC